MAQQIGAAFGRAVFTTISLAAAVTAVIVLVAVNTRRTQGAAHGMAI